MIKIPNAEIRKWLEWRYTDTCNVYVYENQVDPTTFQTTQVKVKLLENIPCRLSYQTQAFASLVSEQNEGVPESYQGTKVFMSPDYDIPENSELEVTHLGRVIWFKRSGVPVIHTNHQEVMVEVLDQDG